MLCSVVRWHSFIKRFFSPYHIYYGSSRYNVSWCIRPSCKSMQSCFMVIKIFFIWYLQNQIFSCLFFSTNPAIFSIAICNNNNNIYGVVKITSTVKGILFIRILFFKYCFQVCMLDPLVKLQHKWSNSQESWPDGDGRSSITTTTTQGHIFYPPYTISCDITDAPTLLCSRRPSV